MPPPSIMDGLPSHLRRWQQIAHQTAPADRAAAEAAVREAYAAAGLSTPRKVRWCSGPTELAALRSSNSFREFAGPNVKGRLLSPLYFVDDEIRKKLPAVWISRMRQHRTANLPTTLSRTVNEAVLRFTGYPPTHRRLRNRILDWLLRRMPSVSEQSFTQAGLNQHDAPNFYIYDFIKENFSYEIETARISGLMSLVANSGWVIPHENLCLICERHNILRTGDNGSLHAADGPALGYPDGWSRHAWKGTLVPHWMIEQSDRIHLHMMEREHDPAIRHCLVDIFSPEKFIGNGYADRVHEDDTGILWKRSWRLGGTWAAVEVINGSPEPDHTYRHYFLQVPGHVRTAREAVAWTYGMSDWQYEQLRIRT